MNELRRSLVGSLSLLLAACAGSAPPPSAPAPDASPGARAEHVLRQCGEERPEARSGCYEQALLATLEAEGVADAMRVLEEMGRRSETVRREGHVYAHAIGLAAYTGAAEVGNTFARCTPAFQSGCYHGVIQSYFADHAAQHGAGHLDAETVNALCRDYRDRPGARWQLFQCAHGLGHGLTLLFGHHLPRSLQGCDLVDSPWEREACYGGVFMESIVQATMPHHGVGRPQRAGHPAEPEHDHHGGHGGESEPAAHAHHAAAPAAEPFPALDPQDPLYPCTVLEARYLNACYQMQTSAILYFNQGDVAAAGRACAAAPEPYRYACYQSLGRDISAYTVQDHARALEQCALVDPRYRSACHDGYAKNLVDLAARPEDGLEFCGAMPEGPEKRRCYEAVGEQIWVLAEDTPRREALCAAAEPEYLAACREGAGL